MHQGDESQGGPEEDGPPEEDGAHDGLVCQGELEFRSSYAGCDYLVFGINFRCVLRVLPFLRGIVFRPRSARIAATRHLRLNNFEATVQVVRIILK